MTRRLTALCRGLLATAAAVALLAGIPLVLSVIGGNPISDVVDVLGDKLASDNTRAETIFKAALTALAWLCYLQLTYAFAVETLAAIRGHVSRRVAALPGVQALAARLIATITLSITSVTPPTAAFTASLPAIEHIDTPTLVTAAVGTQRMPIGAPAPSGKAATTTAETTTYTVAARDTLWSIAERHLGDGLRWRDIRDLNAGRTMPDGTRITDTTEDIRPGWPLLLPADATTPLDLSSPHHPDHERFVDVDPGDHFWQLAKDTLTDAWGRVPNDHELAPYWATMIELNRNRLAPPGDPNLIYPGQRFALPPIPADTTKAAVAQAPTPPAAPTAAPSAPNTQPAPRPTTTTNQQPASTVSPTTRAAHPQPAEPSAAVPAPDNASIRNVVLGIGALATAAGALALTLRRYRKRQAARRYPGTPLPHLSDEAIDYETTIRPIADSEAARWIAATNHLLTHAARTASPDELPQVVAMRAGAHGVEILLDQPCPPLPGFRATTDTTWTLEANDLAALEKQVGDEHPYSPALLPVGHTGAGDLYLDLEQIGILTIDGEPHSIADWLRTLTLATNTVPWAEHTSVVAIGIGIDVGELERVEILTDPRAWLESIAKEMRALVATEAATPYERRIRGGAIYHPTIVITGADHADLADEIAELAALRNTPIALIALTPQPVGARAHLTRERATIEPYGFDFDPACTSHVEAAAIDELVATAREYDQPPPEPADESECEQSAAGPSVEDIIAELTCKRPIEIELLRPQTRVRGLGQKPPAKTEAIIAYLAYHRSVSTQRLRETFWPDSQSRKTADNAISNIRQLLGHHDDGTPRLTEATNTGRYELSNDIGCDWHTFSQLAAHAKNRPATEKIELLTAALTTVQGSIATDAGRGYAWLFDDYQIYGYIEHAIIEQAHALGDLALDAGNHELADWAADKGLAVQSDCEALQRIKMRAAAARNDSAGLAGTYQAVCHAAQQHGPWTEPQPETEALGPMARGR